jgi:hypothetical protein
MVMPMLPMKMPKQLIKAEAGPYHPSAASIKLTPGVRTQLALIVAGSNQTRQVPRGNISSTSKKPFTPGGRA